MKKNILFAPVPSPTSTAATIPKRPIAIEFIQTCLATLREMNVANIYTIADCLTPLMASVEIRTALIHELVSLLKNNGAEIRPQMAILFFNLFIDKKSSKTLTLKHYHNGVHNEFYPLLNLFDVTNDLNNYLQLEDTNAAYEDNYTTLLSVYLALSTHHNELARVTPFLQHVDFKGPGKVIFDILRGLLHNFPEMLNATWTVLTQKCTQFLPINSLEDFTFDNFNENPYFMDLLQSQLQYPNREYAKQFITIFEQWQTQAPNNFLIIMAKFYAQIQLCDTTQDIENIGRYLSMLTTIQYADIPWDLEYIFFFNIKIPFELEPLFFKTICSTLNECGAHDYQGRHIIVNFVANCSLSETYRILLDEAIIQAHVDDPKFKEKSKDLFVFFEYIRERIIKNQLSFSMRKSISNFMDGLYKDNISSNTFKLYYCELHYLMAWSETNATECGKQLVEISNIVAQKRKEKLHVRQENEISDIEVKILSRLPLSEIEYKQIFPNLLEYTLCQNTNAYQAIGLIKTMGTLLTRCMPEQFQDMKNFLMEQLKSKQKEINEIIKLLVRPDKNLSAHFKKPRNNYFTAHAKLACRLLNYTMPFFSHAQRANVMVQLESITASPNNLNTNIRFVIDVLYAQANLLNQEELEAQCAMYTNEIPADVVNIIMNYMSMSKISSNQ